MSQKSVSKCTRYSQVCTGVLHFIVGFSVQAVSRKTPIYFMMIIFGCDDAMLLNSLGLSRGICDLHQGDSQRGKIRQDAWKQQYGAIQCIP